MLITSIRPTTWLVAALAAVTALVAAAIVAASLGPAPLPDPAGGAGLAAQPEVGCGAESDPNDPHCQVGDHDDGEGEERPDLPGAPGGGEGACIFVNGRSGPILASYRGADRSRTVLVAQTGAVEVPCYMDVWGWYNSSDRCYYGDFPEIRLATSGVPEPPEGETEEDGSWYYLRCLVEVIGELPNQDYVIWAVERWAWVDNVDVPTVTPLQVAQDWLARVALHGVEIQLAPPVTGAGLVDLPVWLGVNRSADTWGPTNDSHCLSGVCVTIQAHVAGVEWTMGDGTVVTCAADQHVAWEPGIPFLSPGDNCHHYYRRASRDQPDGKYQITATSTWAVHWEAGASAAAGDLETARTAEVSLQIDEIQVLVGDR
jgi:hypothetical protein